MFVLGGAVHNQRWLAEATDFVREHRARLAGRPPWTFSVGMPTALPAPWRRMAARRPCPLNSPSPTWPPSTRPWSRTCPGRRRDAASHG
jgi:hypothetical protein